MSCLHEESINFLWLQVSLQWLGSKLWEAEGESRKLLGSANFNIRSLTEPWFDNNLLVSLSCKILTRSIIKCVIQLLNLMDRAVQSPGSGSVSPPAAKHLLKLGSCSFLAPDSSVSSGLVVGFLGNSGSFCEKTGKKGTSVVAWLPRVQLEFLGAGSGSSAPQISLFEEAENKLCAFKKAQVLEEAPAYLHVRVFH